MDSVPVRRRRNADCLEFVGFADVVLVVSDFSPSCRLGFCFAWDLHIVFVSSLLCIVSGLVFFLSCVVYVVFYCLVVCMMSLFFTSALPAIAVDLLSPLSLLHPLPLFSLLSS